MELSDLSHEASSLAVWAVSAIGTFALFALLPWPVALSGTILTVMLTALSFIDLRVMILPDALTWPLIAIGLGLSVSGLGPPLFDASLGGLFGYGVMLLIAQSYRRVRGMEGLGLGDAKLLCGLGIWTGALMLPVIIFVASTTGLAWYAARNFRRPLSLQHQLAFGPFLALAGWLAFIAVNRGIDPVSLLARSLANLMA